MICLVTENKKGAKSKEIDDHSDIMFYILKQRKNQDPIVICSFISPILSATKQVFFSKEKKRDSPG